MVKQTDDTPDRILTAATKIFAHKGLAGARVNEIAESAGVNKALIFYYYSSKAGLYREVLRRSFGALIERLFDQVLAEGTVEERIEHMIQTYIGYLATHPDIPRLVMFELMDGLPHIRPIVEELVLREPHGLPDVLVGILSEGATSGRFRDVDPDQTVLSLIGMMVFPFIAKPFVRLLRPDIDLDDGDFFERRKEAVADLLFHGLLRLREDESK